MESHVYQCLKIRISLNILTQIFLGEKTSAIRTLFIFKIIKNKVRKLKKVKLEAGRLKKKKRNIKVKKTDIKIVIFTSYIIARISYTRYISDTTE